MAKTRSSLNEHSGRIGDEVYYTRFGKTFVRRRPKQFNDRQSEAQLRQRALFKARQKTSALFGTILQRGLTKEAHEKGMTEANYFSRLNKDCFVYNDGTVLINYPALLVAKGPLPIVGINKCRAKARNVKITFYPNLEEQKANPDDVVHIYAIEPQVEICQLMASVKRQDGQAAVTLPDLSDEVDGNTPTTFYLYAIVESSSTAHIPTLSAAEKQQHKLHRNINRRVSQSMFIGTVCCRGQQ